MEKQLSDIIPIMAIENDCILSKQGDITLAYKVELPEIFSLSNSDYEAFHQTWVKAIKTLPKHSVLHKQDWFLEKKFHPDFEKNSAKDDVSFLTMASDRFFNERPYLDHSCYVFLTKKPAGRKLSNSMFSNLIRPSIVPNQTLQPKMLQDFIDACGQFVRILEDSGFVTFQRLVEKDLISHNRKKGIIEKYCFLTDDDESYLIKDIELKDGIQIGDQYAELFSLGDAEDLPALCGSRINYDRYSTDRTKFSIGFSSALGQLLSCNHIYNQYVFINDSAETIQQLERKRLRLQSLSAYSRENLISRDATNDFLNEAISAQRLPVKAHYNILVWADTKEELKGIKNQVSSALAQMDAIAKQETDGAAQMWWAGIPGNAAGFPTNDTFDTFVEQATCFFNYETGYLSSPSPFGLRLGDRLTGKPVHVDLSDLPMKRGWITSRNRFVLGPSGGYRAIFN